MSFFDEVPPPEPPPEPEYRPPAWLSAPDNMLPASVAIDVVLAHTPEVAVAICGARIYPDGVAFELQVRRRTPQQVFQRPFVFHGPRERGDLHVGVAYADGRRAVLGRWRRRGPGADAEPDISLTEAGGGGSDRRWEGRFWLWPLPPEGPLTFVCAWIDEGIEETTVEVDSAPLRAAAARAIELWPDERPERPRRPPGASGWTAYGSTGG